MVLSVLRGLVSAERQGPKQQEARVGKNTRGKWKRVALQVQDVQHDAREHDAQIVRRGFVHGDEPFVAGDSCIVQQKHMNQPKRQNVDPNEHADVMALFKIFPKQVPKQIFFDDPVRKAGKQDTGAQTGNDIEF